MRFTSLSRPLLLDLKCRGYNLLTSYNSLDLSNSTWQPLRVHNVHEYLLQMNFNGSNTYLKKPTILVIDQVLKHIDDNKFGGEVFVEDDHSQRLQQKCRLYDLRYHFTANPEIYDFSFDPQRLLIRNHALRTGDHDIYFKYLAMYYQEHVTYERRDIEELTGTLMCLDANQAEKWFKKHDVTVMESDIWICDEDAILKVFAVKEHDHHWGILDDTEEMIYNLINPQELVLLRDIFWIDPRII